MMMLLLALVAMLVIQPMLVAAKKGGDEKKKGGGKGLKGEGEAEHEEGEEAGHEEGVEEEEEAGEDEEEEKGKEEGGKPEEEGTEEEGTEDEGAKPEEGTEEEEPAGGKDKEEEEGAGGKPDCRKKGGMCGDPKIVGGNGVVFYFHGRMDQDFCLVSDSDLHINAHFIGKRPEGRTRDFTWVQALGFVFGHHSLTIAAKPAAKWDNKVDHLELAYNGVPFSLDSWWISPNSAMKLNRMGATNSVDLVIKEKMGVALTVVPIGKEENRVHKYGITDDDCFAHIDMQFRFYNLSSSVNGVLGQTYQPGFVNPVKRGVTMPIMGCADRFVSSSLLATDCKTSQYTATPVPLGPAMPSFQAICGRAGLPGGIPGGITCRR